MKLWILIYYDMGRSWDMRNTGHEHWRCLEPGAGESLQYCHPRLVPVGGLICFLFTSFLVSIYLNIKDLGKMQYSLVRFL